MIEHTYDYVRVKELSFVEYFMKNFGYCVRKNFLINAGRLLFLGGYSVG